MVKILKTIDWEDCKDVVLRLAKDIANQEMQGTPSNFCDLFAMFPTLMQKDMLQEITERLTTEPFDDVTATSVADEDSTLLVHEVDDEALALNIVINHLQTRDYPVSWRYLDCQKKAVAKFCHPVGVDKVYLFCTAQRMASVLHLIEVEEQIIAVPVLFCTDVQMVDWQDWADKEMERLQHGYLREYLPREIGNLLSKKKHRTHCANPSSSTRRSRRVDKGDSL